MSGELVLVTGAAGYIAAHIIKQLMEAGYRVRGSVRDLTNKQKMEHLYKLCPDAKCPLELVEADLLNADSWLPAVADCRYVLHTACPVMTKAMVEKIPDEETAVIKPAVDGTMNVLRAAKTKSVKRVVITGTINSIVGNLTGDTKLYTEADWSDLDNPSLASYPRAKTMAEKAAWSFMETIKEPDHTFELTVLNPSLVIGPVLSTNTSVVVQYMYALFNGIMKPNNALVPIVDVRDVATAHLNAMKQPEVAGRRIILTTQSLKSVDWLSWIADEFNPIGYDIKVEANTKSRAKDIVFKDYGGLKMLKIDPIDPKQTVIEMIYSMIEKGFISAKNQGS